MQPMRHFFVLLMVSLLFYSSLSLARQYGQVLCKTDGFTCKRVKDGQTWETLFPDHHDRNIVMRINRMNTQIWAGMVIAVPANLEEADIMDFSPFPREIQALNEKLVVIDPTVNAWGAYDSNGFLVRWGPGSAGREWCRDIDQSCQTHPGSFRIFSLGSSDCISHKFPLPRGGAPMPYCMYFNNGQALHGEQQGLPGYNASHGCVRMFVNDAEWLRYDFVEGPDSTNNYRGTRVLIREYW
jgi:hypothetical protein